MAKQEGADLANVTDHRLEGEGNLVVNSSALSSIGKQQVVASTDDEGDLSVPVIQSDVAVLVEHFECSQAESEKALRKSKGDLSAALRSLVHT